MSRRIYDGQVADSFVQSRYVMVSHIGMVRTSSARRAGHGRNATEAARGAWLRSATCREPVRI